MFANVAMKGWVKGAGLIAAAVLLGGAVATPAMAKINTISGTLFDVSYDDGILGTFGTPTLSGDTIFFSPSNYKALVTNEDGTAANAALATLTLTAKDGHHFSGLTGFESGVYATANGGSVDLASSLSAFDTQAPGNVQFASLALMTGTSFKNPESGSHGWRASGQLAFGQLAQMPQSLVVNLQSLLMATSDSKPGLAFMQGHLAGVQVAAVPEPETVWMFAMGLLVGGWVLRRRS